LGLLKAELTYWSKQLGSEKQAECELARRTLEAWQKTIDLAEVLDASALQKPPQTERAEWRSLWDEVSSLLTSATSKD
jgi:hypothetical protein